MGRFSRLSLIFVLVIIPFLGIDFPDIFGDGANHENVPPGSTPSSAVGPVGISPYAVQLGSTVTATPSPQNTFEPSATPTATASPTLRPATSTPVIRLDVRSKPILYAFVRAPAGPVAMPFVILTAYRSVAMERPLQIVGKVDGIEFVCPGTPCRVPVSANSEISFQAQDAFGGASSQVRAAVRVESREDGYVVTLEQVSQFFAHRDACSIQWGFDAQDTKQPWNYFPQQPEQLATNKTLHYLAGQLIRNGIADASDCPGGGIDQHGAPNLCGLERARSAMIEWQNSFDFDIWLAGKDLQIPPQILKVLIEAESQFWPSNERSYVDEIGLGQINQLGIDVLLRNDPALYHQICPGVLGDCSVPYPALPESLQKLIRGALLNSLNAYCETCPHRIDISVARQSVTFIALLLRANCKQITQVMDLYDATASYEDHWKFTLMSYHSGLSCVENAVEKLTDADEATDWKHVAHKTECRGAADYVERVWGSLSSFETARFRTDDSLMAAANPVFLPTPTPIPTIGPPPSSAVVWVIVILDDNRNGIPEETEWVNGIPVTLRFPDGSEWSSVTADGKAVFDLTNLPTGAILTINLPTLYRSSKFVVPQRGIVPVVFVFFPPPITPNASQAGNTP